MAVLTVIEHARAEARRAPAPSPELIARLAPLMGWTVATAPAEDIPAVRHGPARYNRGCRCETCRASNTARRRRERHANKGKPVPESVKHGASCYKNWGCRCDVCTVAHAEKCREQKASMRGEPVMPRWTAAELELLGNADLTTWQVAQMTGRTLEAASKKRQRMRGRQS